MMSHAGMRHQNIDELQDKNWVSERAGFYGWLTAKVVPPPVSRLTLDRWAAVSRTHDWLRRSTQ
jgi:hypothetical protein